jgi:hypothetical protein
MRAVSVLEPVWLELPAPETLKAGIETGGWMDPISRIAMFQSPPKLCRGIIWPLPTAGNPQKDYIYA